MSESWKNRKPVSEETRRKMSESWKNRKMGILFKKKEWRPFEEAREFARSLNLKNYREWYQYAKTDERPNDIPSNPFDVYKNDGWKGYPDWLGNEYRIREPLSEEHKRNIGEAGKKSWRPFEEAREFARSLQLKGKEEWHQYCKSGKDGIPKPDDIPSHPNVIYKNDWISWTDWLGNEELA